MMSAYSMKEQKQISNSNAYYLDFFHPQVFSSQLSASINFDLCFLFSVRLLRSFILFQFLKLHDNFPLHFISFQTSFYTLLHT